MARQWSAVLNGGPVGHHGSPQLHPLPPLPAGYSLGYYPQAFYAQRARPPPAPPARWPPRPVRGAFISRGPPRPLPTTALRGLQPAARPQPHRLTRAARARARAAGQAAPMQYWGAWGGGAYGADGGPGGAFPMAAAVAFRPAPALAVPYNHGMPPGGYAGPYNCDVRPHPRGKQPRQPAPSCYPLPGGK
jgi:hypothetical protein